MNGTIWWHLIWDNAAFKTWARICILTTTCSPHLQIPKSMVWGYMDANLIYQQTWRTSQVCRKTWNLLKTIQGRVNSLLCRSLENAPSSGSWRHSGATLDPAAKQPEALHWVQWKQSCSLGAVLGLAVAVQPWESTGLPWAQQ